MGEVLLLEDRTSGSTSVVVHRVRLADRLAARARGLDLDRQLAAGAPPESSAALTLRARALLRPAQRKRMARGLRGLVHHARRPPGVPAGVPLARTQLLDAAQLINRLADRLEDPGPVVIRGVALASLLITNGAGPLYSCEGSRGVGDAVEKALDAISPTREPVADD